MSRTAVGWTLLWAVPVITCAHASEIREGQASACPPSMGQVGAVENGSVDIPYHLTVLENGLTVIVHEDHKAPIVAVNIWYHVGSKDERPGRTGLAHLFEHLMFNGSEHFNDDWFKAMERVGATGMNGTTSEDRTNYFQEVPRDALAFALWMESDRMGHLLGALTQERLDEQRGVVLNEKRQGDNQPYRIAWRLITQNTWPVGHPYSWEVIGSEEDLKAATLEDTHAWFRDFYGPANAVLVIAGDVETQEAVELARRAFGHIPPGPPVQRHTAYIAKRSGVRRMTAQDRVPQARIYKVWNIPQYGTTEGTLLSVAAGVLADGKTSRLYRRLVHDAQLATDVNAWADLREIAGQFVIIATVRLGVTPREVERAIDEEVARLLKEGPRSDELQRVKARFEADFVRGCERVGGFGGKSDVLARNAVLTGDPAYYKTLLRETLGATRTTVRDTARAWLADGAFVLTVEPFPEYHATANDMDRSRVPFPTLKPQPQLPAFQQTRLANGLRVILAERHDMPLAQMTLLIPSGFAADRGGVAGTASLAAAMLDEGTRSRDAMALSAELEALGARLDTGCGPDTVTVSLNTLTRHLDKAVELFADVVVNPTFPAEDFKRLQQQRLAAIQREKSTPNGVAMRVLPRLIFGADHPYAAPLSGNGDEAGVAALTRDDLQRFYTRWFRPDQATLVVAGAVKLDQLRPALERHFGAWRARSDGETERPFEGLNATTATAARATVLYLIDRPGAAHSTIMAGCPVAAKREADEAPIQVMNAILGGTFTSRINMNLREDKHWSYGARSSLIDMRGERIFLCSTSVQADKTAAALRELKQEVAGLQAERPPAPAEVDKVVADLTLRLGGQWETLGAVGDVMQQMVRLGLSENYFRRYAEALRGVSVADVQSAAQRVARADALVWLVVGDRARLMPELEALGWGPVTVLDADGYPCGGTAHD
ncbi:MAG TPA: pitrilysin family protein [Kiritimatiellia bacterium]|nr:pitrilysin family protein [Kiritimatiellia bacterium]HRU71402.1 pitrilysin family protein [Kiritimatiellia bacterium]